MIEARTYAPMRRWGERSLVEKSEAMTNSYLASWKDEIDSAALYRALSETEENPELSRVYARLADVEEERVESSGAHERK